MKKDSSLVDLGENKQYAQLHELINTVDAIDPKDWTSMHVIAYVAQKYKSKFGDAFILSYGGPPSKCVEYKMSSRIGQMLGAKPGKYHQVKDFIDWFYENYNGKRKFTSFGALCKPEKVEQFLADQKRKSKIHLNDLLPDSILNILSSSSFAYARTYKELLFILEYSKTATIKESDNLLLEQVKSIFNPNSIEV